MEKANTLADEFIAAANGQTKAEEESGPVLAMHIKGGIIQEYKSVNEFKTDNVYKEWLRIGRRPKSGCRHCWGRGWVGRYADTGTVDVCRCTYKKCRTPKK